MPGIRNDLFRGSSMGSSKQLNFGNPYAGLNSGLNSANGSAMSTFSKFEADGVSQTALKQLIEQKLFEQKRKLEKHHKIEIKNVKKVTTQLAIDFVKNSSEDIQKNLTKEHKQLLTQFIDFKRRTWTIIDELTDCRERMTTAELIACQSYPVYEQRHAADPKHPLRLYNCLKP